MERDIRAGKLKEEMTAGSEDMVQHAINLVHQSSSVERE